MAVLSHAVFICLCFVFECWTHQGSEAGAGVDSMLKSQFNHCRQPEDNGLHVLLPSHGTAQLPQSVYVAPPMRLHLRRSPQAALHHCLTEAPASWWPQHALAVGAVPQPQQGPATVPARPQVVCGVDHLDAQVQRLQEDSGGQEGTRQTGHHQFGIWAKCSRVLPSSSHTLLRRRGHAAPQQAAIRHGEEATVQHGHHVVHRGV